MAPHVPGCGSSPRHQAVSRKSERRDGPAAPTRATRRSSMPHDHAHHHDHAGPGKERRLAIVALLTGGFMVAEVAGGLLSGSLALLADAGHMLTDFASLALAWAAARLATRPADWKRTYGFDRFSVLAAFVNGVALLGIAIWIIVEAVGRFMRPGRRSPARPCWPSPCLGSS